MAAAKTSRPPLLERVRGALRPAHTGADTHARRDGFSVIATDEGVRVRYASMRAPDFAFSRERDEAIRGYADTLTAAGFTVALAVDRSDLALAAHVTEAAA